MAIFFLTHQNSGFWQANYLNDDLIITHNPDLIFLTAAWLDQDNSAAVLLQSFPPNFSFMGEARVHEKGGGVVTLSNNSQITTTTVKSTQILTHNISMDMLESHLFSHCGHFRRNLAGN